MLLVVFRISGYIDREKSTSMEYSFCALLTNAVRSNDFSSQVSGFNNGHPPNTDIASKSLLKFKNWLKNVDKLH